MSQSEKYSELQHISLITIKIPNNKTEGGYRCSTMNFLPPHPPPRPLGPQKPQVQNPYSPHFRATAVISAIVVHFCNCNVFLDKISNFIPHLPTTIYGISPHGCTADAKHLWCRHQCHRCSPKLTAATNINPLTPKCIPLSTSVLKNQSVSAA